MERGWRHRASVRSQYSLRTIHWREDLEPSGLPEHSALCARRDGQARKTEHARDRRANGDPRPSIVERFTPGPTAPGSTFPTSHLAFLFAGPAKLGLTRCLGTSSAGAPTASAAILRVGAYVVAMKVAAASSSQSVVASEGFSLDMRVGPASMPRSDRLCGRKP